MNGRIISGEELDTDPAEPMVTSLNVTGPLIQGVTVIEQAAATVGLIGQYCSLIGQLYGYLVFSASLPDCGAPKYKI